MTGSKGAGPSAETPSAGFGGQITGVKHDAPLLTQGAHPLPPTCSQSGTQPAAPAPTSGGLQELTLPAGFAA